MIVDRHGDRHYPAGAPGRRGGQYAPKEHSGGWLQAAADQFAPPGERTETAYRAAVEYRDQQTGLTVATTLVRTDGRLRIDAYIRNRDNIIVGAVRWYGETTPDTIRLDEITLAGPSRDPGYKIDPAGYQGQGFMTRYRAHYRAHLKTLGFERIVFLADIDVGGFAWATAGADFRDNRARADIRARARRKLIQFPQYKADVEALAARKDSTPVEWARIGWSPGLSTWFGKRVMLGSDWAAVDDL